MSLKAARSSTFILISIALLTMLVLLTGCTSIVPRSCCEALIAKCLACSEGVTVEEYCEENPTTVECPAQEELIDLAAECEQFCEDSPGSVEDTLCTCGNGASVDFGYLLE